MPSTDHLDEWNSIVAQKRTSKVDVFAAFGFDEKDHQPCTTESPNYKCMHGQCGCWKTSGVAYVGGACRSNMKASINEYGLTPAQSAWVY